MALGSPTVGIHAALCAIGALTLIATAQGRTSPHSLHMRAHVEASGDQVLVGDLALPLSQDDRFASVAQLPIAPSPRPGEHVTMTRAQLQAVLGAAWRIDGAVATTVTRKSQEMPWQHLCDAALSAVESRMTALGPSYRHQLACGNPAIPALVLPAGDADLRPDLGAWRASDGVQQVPVDVLIKNRVERRVSVALDARLDALQWCARDARAEGTAIEAAEFDRCWRPVRRPAQALVATGTVLPTGRLRHALRPGDALLAADVAPVGALLAGDRVTVRCREGAVVLEEAGELEQDAQVGDAVRVRVGQASRALTGHLEAQQVVELESH